MVLVSLSLLLLPLMGREVEGEDRSSCLSRTSLIRFRSSDLEAEPARPLYIFSSNLIETLILTNNNNNPKINYIMI